MAQDDSQPRRLIVRLFEQRFETAHGAGKKVRLDAARHEKPKTIPQFER